MKMTAVSIFILSFELCLGFVAFPTLDTMYATSVSLLYFAVDNLLDMINELPVKVSVYNIPTTWHIPSLTVAC